MTEKRFTVGNYDEGVKLTDNVECEHYFWTNKHDCDDLCDLLNELHEENKQLSNQLNENLNFLIQCAEKQGFTSLDHMLYTLDEGKILGYATENWEMRQKND